MPARISKTFPRTGNSHPHREHRSRRGRKIGKNEKSADFLYKLSLDERGIEKTNDQNTVEIDLDGLFTDPLKISPVFKTKRKYCHKLRSSDDFPSLICENCGEKNKLHFDPRKTGGNWLLKEVICKGCGKRAFYENYYSFKDLQFLFFSSFFIFVRQLIKIKKGRLTDFI